MTGSNAPTSTLRIVRPDNPAAALGRAVSYLMTKPAFAKLQFGDWSRILVGQINRKHFCFVVDGASQVQGFMGWALASEEHAKAWAEGRRALAFEDSLRGDCMVVNAFAAEFERGHAFPDRGSAPHCQRQDRDLFQAALQGRQGARRAYADQRVRRPPHRAKQRATGRGIRRLANHRPP